MAKAPKPISTPFSAVETDASEEQPFVQTDYDNGDMEFDFGDAAVKRAVLGDVVVNPEDAFFENLAEDMDEDELDEIGAEVLARYKDDVQSRSEWLETVASGLSLLGIKLDETGGAFPGACTAHHPLILESAVKFQAKAANVMFDAKGPVKTAIIGEVTEEKEMQAARVAAHMNYQVMHQMDEYFEETESMLFYLPIVGSAFKKTYMDTRLGRPTSVFVPVDNFVVNYYTSNLKTAPCFTHKIEITDNDYKKDVDSGFYRDIELSIATTDDRGDTTIVIDEMSGTQPKYNDSVHTVLEQYVDLQIESDDNYDKQSEIALPYVVTIDAPTGKVLSIRRNWLQDDDYKKKIVPFTHYKFVPGLGFYGLGFIHLLGNLQMTLTSAMRSLVDSGSFSNLQGGFVDKRLRLRSNDGPIAPGEYKEVEAGGIPLNQAFYPLPFKEPSQVLMQMYKFVEERAQTFADSTEQVISDSSNYGPVGTTMALLEASTKFFSGVHKRLHKAQKNEFKILAALNYEYLDDLETFDVVGSTFEISRDDYDGSVDIVPVSDPNLGSQAQRMAQAQAVLTAAQQAGQLHDMVFVYRRFYLAMGVDAQEVDKLLPKPEEAQEADPMSDIMAAQQGKPIKAFPEQDHDSHIALKSAFMQDPATGGNPMMAAIMPRIQANIQEHIVLKFMTSVQGQVANDMQDPAAAQAMAGMPQEALLAQAAQKVAQTNAALQAAQAQGPDTARMILAQNDTKRVQLEEKKVANAADDSLGKQIIDQMKLVQAEYATQIQVVIAEMQTQSKANMAAMQNDFNAAMESLRQDHATQMKSRDHEHAGAMAAIQQQTAVKTVKVASEKPEKKVTDEQ